jgi:hypothetical protein
MVSRTFGEMVARVPIPDHWGPQRCGTDALHRGGSPPWFPTRLNGTPTDIPTDHQDLDGDGSVALDLSSRPLGGVLNNHIDTLHADFAFIISPEPFVKRRGVAGADVITIKAPKTWDFALYPNPAREEAWLRFESDTPKDIQVLDAMGRLLCSFNSVTATDLQIDLCHVASGLVSIRVSEGEHVGYKKLLIQ